MKSKRKRNTQNNYEDDDVGDEVDSGTFSVSTSSRTRNGGFNKSRLNGSRNYDTELELEDDNTDYNVREVDVSQIPPEIMSNMVKILPQEGGTLNLEDIDEETEGWILQCPKNVNLRSVLKGSKISMKGKPTILSSDDNDHDRNSSTMPKVFEAVAVTKSVADHSLFLLLPDANGDFKMASTYLRGYIRIQQHLEILEAPEIHIPKKRRRKLPSGIKERHPIYGIDFSEALSKKRVTRSLQRNAKEHASLSKTIDDEGRDASPTKKHKKSKYLRHSEKAPEPETIVSAPAEVLSPSKKSRKRKRESEPCIEEQEVDEDSEEIAQKLKKLKRSKSRDKELSCDEMAQKLKKLKRSKSSDRDFL